MQKLLYLWNSRVEKPVFSLIVGWIVGGESLLAFVSPYISSLPLLNRDRSRLNDNYRTLLQLSL